MKYKIKSFLLDRKNVAVGTLQVVGKDGSFNVPGGGANYLSFFIQDLNKQERVTMQKQFKNFEKLLRQVDRKATSLGLGNITTKGELSTKIQDNIKQ